MTVACKSSMRILAATEPGDPHAADQLLPLVYDELHKLAAQLTFHSKVWHLKPRQVVFELLCPMANLCRQPTEKRWRNRPSRPLDSRAPAPADFNSGRPESLALAADAIR